MLHSVLYKKLNLNYFSRHFYNKKSCHKLLIQSRYTEKAHSDRKKKKIKNSPASLLLSVLSCELGCWDIGPGVPVEPAGDLASSGPVLYELRDCEGGRW